jgi:hypothetical protein
MNLHNNLPSSHLTLDFNLFPLIWGLAKWENINFDYFGEIGCFDSFQKEIRNEKIYSHFGLKSLQTLVKQNFISHGFWSWIRASCELKLE